MAALDFPTLFQQASGGKNPYPYQIRLAGGTGLPNLLEIPTGAGKTLAIFLAWLWRRRYHPDPRVRAATPRRLIYCLPMRVLVDQTVGVVRESLRSLEALPNLDGRLKPVKVAVLMGGDDDGDWDDDPTSDVVVVGTQDMLLSRALNRGYGMSRFRWPHHFGLVNSDCLWAIDEVQLMGNGLATSAQLDGFRQSMKVAGPYHTMWLSATIDASWLNTIDSRVISSSKILALDDADRADPQLSRRLTAAKSLARLPLVKPGKPYSLEELAQKVAAVHVEGTLSLVILNTVERAQKLTSAFHRLYAKALSPPDIALVHSRFRPADRAELMARVVGPTNGPGRIVIATQVVEAGIDVSARTLVTELAPWASLVQRLGRCNRYGEASEAKVFWIDLDPAKYAAPYEPELLTLSQGTLRGLEGQSVSPDRLPRATTGPVPTHVLRRRDLVDLFDTTSDLSGNDIDVSRFIRDTDDFDLQVFWRDWENPFTAPPNDSARPRRAELCSVPIMAAREFLQAKPTPPAAWAWDHLDRTWRRVDIRSLRPGMVLLLHASSGGYSSTLGWTGKTGDVTPPLPDEGLSPPEGTDDDNLTIGAWQTLADHSNEVVSALDVILDGLTNGTSPPIPRNALTLAARWHDRGKAHSVFQETLLRSIDSPSDRNARAAAMWAKSPFRGQRHSQKHFRHELASALAVLQTGDEAVPPENLDLVAYLAAAHHGKVRLGIRSLPDEVASGAAKRFVLGIADGDVMPVTDLGGGIVAPMVKLDLAVSELGLSATSERSWVERSTALLDRFGPFYLAYLEALLICADVRASQSRGQGGKA